jgi:hypothetical protein
MPTLTLDRLPPAPAVSFPAPKRPVSDTVAGLLERGLAIVTAAEEMRLELERYLGSLRTMLDRLCREAKERDREDLDIAILILLDRERKRAEETLPVLQMIKATRAKGKKSKAGARYQFYLAWEKEFTPIEEALISELEALRDARLRLEIRRADLINEGKEDGPIFASAKDAAAHLRSIRK